MSWQVGLIARGVREKGAREYRWKTTAAHIVFIRGPSAAVAASSHRGARPRQALSRSSVFLVLAVSS